MVSTININKNQKLYATKELAHTVESIKKKKCF